MALPVHPRGHPTGRPSTLFHVARRDPDSLDGRAAIVETLDNIDAVWGPNPPEHVAAVRAELAELLRSSVAEPPTVLVSHDIDGVTAIDTYPADAAGPVRHVEYPAHDLTVAGILDELRFTSAVVEVWA